MCRYIAISERKIVDLWADTWVEAYEKFEDEFDENFYVSYYIEPPKGVDYRLIQLVSKYYGVESMDLLFAASIKIAQLIKDYNENS